MVYGTYNYIVNGVYKPTYNWGAHIVHSVKLTIHQQQSRNGWLDIQFNIILHYLILYSIYTPIFTCTIEKQNTFTLFYSITPVIWKKSGPHPVRPSPASPSLQPFALQLLRGLLIHPLLPGLATPIEGHPGGLLRSGCTRRKSSGPLRPGNPMSSPMGLDSSTWMFRLGLTIWLVVATNLSEKWSSSIGIMKIPIYIHIIYIWRKTCSNHQPAMAICELKVQFPTVFSQ